MEKKGLVLRGVGFRLFAQPSGIGCGGGGGGTTIGAPEPGGSGEPQQIIGSIGGGIPGLQPWLSRYFIMYQPAQPLVALPKGGGSGIIAITASASVTSPITSLILGRRNKGLGVN